MTISNHVPVPAWRIPEAWPADPALVMAVQHLNQHVLLGSRTELKYSLDPRIGRMIVQAVDKESGEVVDQLPSEYVVELAASSRFTRTAGFAEPAAEPGHTFVLLA